MMCTVIPISKQTVFLGVRLYDSHSFTGGKNGSPSRMV